MCGRIVAQLAQLERNDLTHVKRRQMVIDGDFKELVEPIAQDKIVVLERIRPWNNMKCQKVQEICNPICECEKVLDVCVRGDILLLSSSTIG